jgi:hypothetical protein
VLVRGTDIRNGERGISLRRSEYTGVIEECDWAARTVRVRLQDAGGQQLTAGVPGGDLSTIDAEFTGISNEDASALVGRMVHISNDQGNSPTHRIVAADAVDGGVELTLDYDPRVAEGPVTEIADGSVTSGVNFHLDRFGYMRGKTLANEDTSVSWRISHVDGHNTPVIDTAHEGEVPAATLEQAFADSDGDGVQRLVMYDYGPGDTVMIPCWASVTRR